MAINSAFQPMGKTIKIFGSVGNINNYTMTSDGPCNQYLCVNHSGNPVYVWISPTASPTNVAVPTGNGANAGYAITIGPNITRVITGPQVSASTSVQVSCSADAGTPTAFICPGEGL